MKPRSFARIQLLFLTLACGISLRFVVGLEPVWWLAWIAPAPLLALAWRSDTRHARWLTAIAALIAASANLSYYTTVMPVAVAFAVTVAQASLWVLAVMGARRVVLRHDAWWTMLAYPVLWTAIDTLMAALLPDGNWGNIGYSQYNFLPALQITSLFGVAGLTFLLSLVASALAMALAFGVNVSKTRHACAIAALSTIAALGYGGLRLQTASDGADTVFGLVAVDDATGLNASHAYSEAIWQRYEQHITTLARQGARIIVLPEKVAMLSPTAAAAAQQRMAALAARLNVWIDIGIGIDQGDTKADADGVRPDPRSNLAWLLSPQGTLAASYQKHHLAPPELGYSNGSGYTLHAIDGLRYGLAICKDMHFASLGRAYGKRQASVMLVPAWDFGADRQIATGMTTARGVENGYTVVRSAREGLLTVTDPYGRVLASASSAFMPGAALLVRAKVPAQVPTLYTHIGNFFGWLCVIIAAAFAAATVFAGWRLRAAAPAEYQ